MRPAFALRPSQEPLGPLVLSESWVHRPSSVEDDPPLASQSAPATSSKPAIIQVPAAINTQLRDYQRAGVRFFWDRYAEGRGGLLGDDMGLVRRLNV